MVPGPRTFQTLKIFNVIINATTYLRHIFETLPECLRNDSEATIIWTTDKPMTCREDADHLTKGNRGTSALCLYLARELGGII